MQARNDESFLRGPRSPPDNGTRQGWRGPRCSPYLSSWQGLDSRKSAGTLYQRSLVNDPRSLLHATGLFMSWPLRKLSIPAFPVSYPRTYFHLPIPRVRTRCETTRSFPLFGTLSRVISCQGMLLSCERKGGLKVGHGLGQQGSAHFGDMSRLDVGDRKKRQHVGLLQGEIGDDDGEQVNDKHTHVRAY